MNRLQIPFTLLAAAGMLFFPLSKAFTPQGVSFVLPDVPPSKVNGAYAEQWRFLEKAKRTLPEAVSFTVRHPDLDSEMSLFMFSLGMLLDQQPLPSSYFNGSRPDGLAAEYILAMRPVIPDEPGLLEVARFKEGKIYQRVRPGR